MTLDALIAYAESLPGAEAKLKIGHHLTYEVGGKTFLWIGQDNTPVTCSFKCSDEDFTLALEQEGYAPAPYMAHNKWVMCCDIELMSPQDAEQHIGNSYRVMVDKLPKKVQEALKDG